MDKIVGGLSSSTAAAYLGARYGLSLAARDAPLTPKLGLFGLMAELRGGWLEGLRFYWDYVPVVRDTSEGESLKLGWKRLVLGWAFEFEMPALVDRIHLTPKLGHYSMTARMITSRDAAGKPVTRELSIAGATGAGLELDVELGGFFYILRGWAARDVPLSSLTGGGEQKTVTSTRLGLDLFLKGGGFPLLGRSASLTYLLFAMNESLLVRDEAGGPEDFIEVAVPFAGFGLSLAL
jgi:hypothetical protein